MGDEKIRERLDDWVHPVQRTIAEDYPGGDSWVRVRIADALRAVLELHEPALCVDEESDFYRQTVCIAGCYTYPCDTVTAIAEYIGRSG